MEIGASFDDDFFEKSPEKKEKVPLKYDAKICSPKWFMDPQCTDEGNPDQLSNLRHQADFYYFSKKFEDASRIYHRCLEIVPVNNTTVRRECMENLARSLLHMGQEEKSLEWALRLYDLAYTTDQLLIAWNLLAVVCHKLGKFAEEMEALESCLEAHRFFPDLWLRFAYCHAGLVDINLPDSGVTRTHKFSRKAPCCPFHERNSFLYATKREVPSNIDDLSAKQTDCNIVYDLSSDCSDNDGTRKNAASVNNSKCEVCSVGAQIVTACLLRARFLIESANAHHRSFGSEKKVQLENKIAACIKALEMDPDFLEQASQMLQSDMMEEMKKNNENSDTSALDTQKCSRAEESHVSGEPKEGSSCSQATEQQPATSES